MEKYLEFLIEDLRAISKSLPAHDPKFDGTISEDQSFEKHIEQVESYLNSIPQPLSETVGISREQLPKVELLTPVQIDRLYPELELFLSSFNYYLDFPEDLPIPIRYRLLHENWDQEHIYMEDGMVHIEFCNYNADACQFPEEYCCCKNDEVDDMSNLGPDNGELPF